MPLPTNTSIPLLGCSRPGEVAPSKPKQAMIVRMSAEAFDALQAFPNHPQMIFQFDEKSVRLFGNRPTLSSLSDSRYREYTSETRSFRCGP